MSRPQRRNSEILFRRYLNFIPRESPPNSAGVLRSTVAPSILASPRRDVSGLPPVF